MQVGGLGDHVDADALLLESRGDRVVRVASDEQDTLAPLDVAPAGGRIVTGLGIELGIDVNAIRVGTYRIEAVAQLYHASAPP